MNNEEKTAVLYSVKWTGVLLLVLILSSTTYCTIAKLHETCEFRVSNVTEQCWKQMGSDEIACMDKGVELLNACHDQD
jgi:hypothetical protein